MRWWGGVPHDAATAPEVLTATQESRWSAFEQCVSSLGSAAAVAAIAAQAKGASGSFVYEFSFSLSLDGASVSMQDPSWGSIKTLFFSGLTMLLARNLF